MPVGEANRPSTPDSLALGAIVFLAVLWAFFPAVHNSFLTYDDPQYVTSNHQVQNGLTLEGFKWAFQPHFANLHPVTWLSHMLDVQLFGLRPWGHHFVSICLHAVNALLVFWFLLKVTAAPWRSFAVALLFGLHPLRVESVAWISERKDVLSTLFWMLTLLAYAEYATLSQAQNPRFKLFYAAALVTFALGLLSKSMIVTLPLVLLLLDFWPLGRFQQKSPLYLALEKLPFLLLAGSMTVIAYFALAHGSALVSEFSFQSRAANALISYCRYLEKLFWPENLSVLYPPARHWPAAWVCGAGLLLAAISLVAAISHRRRPWLAVGWFWYLATLAPVIGIIQIGDPAMADRYSYLASLGICLALVWIAAEFSKNWRWQFPIGAAVTAVLAGVCFLLTREQIGYWKNTETLFQHAVATNPDSTLALVGYGACLAERGDYPGAIPVYRQALKVSPNYYEAHANLGLALLATDRVDDAIAEFQLAVQARPGMADGFINLGSALARKGDLAQAIEQMKQAATLDPSNAIAHADLGALWLQIKNPADAAKEFRIAISLAPDNAESHNALGGALATQGQLDDAIAEFQQALKLDPHHAVARANLEKAIRMKSQAQSIPKTQ